MARTDVARTVRLLPVIALALAAIAAAPAVASGDDGAAAYTPKLVAGATVDEKVADTAPVVSPKSLAVVAPIATAPLPKPVYASEIVRQASSAPAGTAVRRTSGATGELAQARAILAGLVAAHPILAGASVSFGDTRGYQAIAYYQSGRIVISPTHTASLSRILNHEVWHVIDWRDNGRIDWGENVPPRQ